MRTFKTNFPLQGVPTFVTVSQLENDIFSVNLERIEMEKENQAIKNPDLLVQRTKNGTWMILDEGKLDLNNKDLQALGRAIENDSPTLI